MSSAAKNYSAEESVWFLNNLMTICRSSAEGRDGVSIMEFRMPYGDSPPLHVHHDDDEIFHLIEGTIRFRVGDKEFVLGAGNTVVAPKGIPHTFRVESRDGARGLNIVASPNFENFVREMGRPGVADTLPPPAALAPDLIARLAAAARKHHMDIIGPPLV